MPDCTTERTDKLLLTVDEAAHALSLSVRTVHKLVASGALATVRIGRCVRFSPETLQKFVRDHVGSGRWVTWDDARMVKELSTRNAPVSGGHRCDLAPGFALAPPANRRSTRAAGLRQSSKHTPKELRILAARIASESS
jgi:excisionase family DNA binding protein